MKKLITIAAAVLTFSAASAQSRNYDRPDRNPVYQQNDRWNNRDNHSTDYGYGRNNDRPSNDYGRNNDRERQAAYDRMNRECDERITVYRNDRSLSRYERDRRIRQVEQERQTKAKSFGKGVVIGAIGGLILGAILGSK